MSKKIKIILLIGLIIYWISPIDLMPGNPIDDLILTIAYALAIKKKEFGISNKQSVYLFCPIRTIKIKLVQICSGGMIHGK